MAFGITPKHTQEATFETLTQEEILIIGLETVKKLNWNIGAVSRDGFLAYNNVTWNSWGEEISVKIEGQKVTLKSECTGSQLMDWGKNKKNVEKFLQAFDETVSALSKEEIAVKYQEIEVSGKEELFNQPPQTSRD